MDSHKIYIFVLPLQKDKEDQWLEKKVQGNKDHIILEHLQWTMGYEVQITAANRLGYSEPTVYEFSMPPKPNIIKGKQNSTLSEAENEHDVIFIISLDCTLIFETKFYRKKCKF